MSERELKKNEILKVHWRDIVEAAGWLDEKVAGAFPLANIAHVGFFLNVGEDKGIAVMRLSSGVTEDGERSVVVIPIANIVNVWRLKEME